MSFRTGRNRKRSDQNMKQIVKDLRDMGYNVTVLSGVGGGVPDLCVAKAGRVWLCEVKKTSKDVLTPDQVDFHAKWTGPTILVGCSADDFVRQMG